MGCRFLSWNLVFIRIVMTLLWIRCMEDLKSLHTPFMWKGIPMWSNTMIMRICLHHCPKKLLILWMNWMINYKSKLFHLQVGLPRNNRSKTGATRVMFRSWIQSYTGNTTRVNGTSTIWSVRQGNSHHLLRKNAWQTWNWATQNLIWRIIHFELIILNFFFLFSFSYKQFSLVTK